jgi:oxysterol-binding protein-related protein 1/2
MSRNDLSSSHELVKQSEKKNRKELPHEMVDRSKISIWSILRQCVDKELYRFTIPIIWNEPLSLLQRMAVCEYYVYVSIC